MNLERAIEIAIGTHKIGAQPLIRKRRSLD